MKKWTVKSVFSISFLTCPIQQLSKQKRPPGLLCWKHFTVTTAARLRSFFLNLLLSWFALAGKCKLNGKTIPLIPEVRQKLYLAKHCGNFYYSDTILKNAFGTFHECIMST